MELKVLSNQMHTATKGSKINISSEKKLGEFANNFSSKLKQGDIFFLYGEMGVGKTTFVKYLINEFQKIKKLPVTEITSPTFNLLNEYQINGLKIKHYDLFRVKNKLDALNLDIFDKDKNIITLIEWPQLIANENKIKSINLTFNYENDLNNRCVDIKRFN